MRDYQREGLAGLQAGWDGQNANKLSAGQRADIKNKVESYRPDQILPRGLRVLQGEFWTVRDLQVAVKTWGGVEYACEDSYRTLLHEAGLSYQRTEGVYRSKPNQRTMADFEAGLEKSDRLPATASRLPRSSAGRDALVFSSDAEAGGPLGNPVSCA